MPACSGEVAGNMSGRRDGEISSAYSQKYPEYVARHHAERAPYARSGAPTSAARVSSICMSARRGNTSRMMS